MKDKGIDPPPGWQSSVAQEFRTTATNIQRVIAKIHTPAPKATPITDEELDTMQRMRKAGFKVKEIAKHLGRNAKVVSGKLSSAGKHKYGTGILKPGVTPADVDRAFAGADFGNNIREKPQFYNPQWVKADQYANRTRGER